MQYSSAAQNGKDYYLYVGKVEGFSKEQFLKEYDEYDIKRDSILGIASIDKSDYEIEIRLYENRSGMAVETCTFLTYDSNFQVKRVERILNGWEEKWLAKSNNPVEKMNPDSMFETIVSNGLFNLPEYTNGGVSKVLTKKGLVKSTALCVTTDGCDFHIEIKISDVFKRIYFSDSEASQLKCFPDNDVVRRKEAIVNLLKSNTRLIKK